MLDKPLLFLLAKLAAMVASFIIASSEKADMVFMIISALSFACLFVTELLLDRIFKKRNFALLLILVALTACFVIGLNILYPLFTVLLLQLFDRTSSGSMFYQLLFVAILLSVFIFIPTREAIALSLILLLLTLLARGLLIKLASFNEINESQKETINELDKKLKDLRGLIKTLKYTASVEERNRIAARIHDQIGHGISGSIIMLEAALMVMKEHPEKAAENVQKAVNNLREGVDEIRTALREERADRYLLGINEVTAMLEEFKVTYNRTVHLKTIGDLNQINLEIWACIHDNLKECLTNLLKHSNATEFTLNIEVYKKIIKVEYKDNGKSEEGFEKDVGLEAIEERTVKAKGRCFFSKGEKGFCVTNIFTY
jgi:signal transduction histidine kinase